MPGAVDITFPRDANGEPIPILPHDFNSVQNGLGQLAGECLSVAADGVYRIVADTDLMYSYGDTTVAALTIDNAPGAKTIRLPANQIEYIWMKTGQTTIAYASPWADGGCVSLIRMR